MSDNNNNNNNQPSSSLPPPNGSPKQSSTKQSNQTNLEDEIRSVLSAASKRSRKSITDAAAAIETNNKKTKDSSAAADDNDNKSLVATSDIVNRNRDEGASVTGSTTANDPSAAVVAAIDDGVPKPPKRPPAEWDVSHEKIFVEWADKAICYRWLHNRSREWYDSANSYFTVPVIVSSTLMGTANFATQNLPVQYQKLAIMMIGLVTILNGILQTVHNYFKIAQLAESHKMSGVLWDKYYRNIKIELSKVPTERIPVDFMLKSFKEEYDRLMETSPQIDRRILKIFKKIFKHGSARKREFFKNIYKPEICDELKPTDEFRNPWFIKRDEEVQANLIRDAADKMTNDENERIDAIVREIIANIRDKQGFVGYDRDLDDDEADDSDPGCADGLLAGNSGATTALTADLSHAEIAMAESSRKENRKMYQWCEEQSHLLKNFKDKFYQEYKRYPTHTEIYENVGEQLSENMMTKTMEFLNKQIERERRLAEETEHIHPEEESSEFPAPPTWSSKRFKPSKILKQTLRSMDESRDQGKGFGIDGSSDDDGWGSGGDSLVGSSHHLPHNHHPHSRRGSTASRRQSLAQQQQKFAIKKEEEDFFSIL